MGDLLQRPQLLNESAGLGRNVSRFPLQFDYSIKADSGQTSFVATR